MGYWDETGCSRPEELNAMLKEFILLRRLKKDVLTELPEKQRQFIYLEDCAEARAERKLLDKMEVKSTADFVKAVKGRFVKGVDHIMTVRRKVGEAKIRAAIEQIGMIKESGKKLIVFGVHTAFLEELHLKFAESVLVTGKTPAKRRQELVDRFQNDEDVRIFIGNIQAAGVGITLTAASDVLICELPWTPSELVQAEDRAHRISQKNTVHVRYLLFKDSIDSYIVELLGQKSKTINSILD
jgi:SWI/SNF-related matrix-associated actin-dependent regulator 1 of chromatin subfamily A